MNFNDHYKKADLSNQSTNQHEYRLVDNRMDLSMNPGSGKIDPRIIRTMDLIYDAFNSLLINKHYEFISIKDIVEAAHLNRATFYLHFQNKDDLIFYCCFRGCWNELMEKFDISSMNGLDNEFISISKVVLLFIQKTYLQWNYQWDEILFEKGTRKALACFFTRWLSINWKQNSTESSVKIDAIIVSSAILGLGITWCYNGFTENVDELSNNLANLFLNGFTGRLSKNPN